MCCLIEIHKTVIYIENVFVGTATDDIGSAVMQYRKGHSYRTTKMGQVNSEIGLLSFTNTDIRENMRALFGAVESHKPESVKRGIYA